MHLGLASGRWLESPITGLVVTILLAIGTTAIAWWAIRPKRLILIDMPEAGSPSSEAEFYSWSDSIANQSTGSPESLHIVKVDLRTKGRWDIASVAFDRDLPLTLDIGVQILAMKAVQPTGVPNLRAEIVGTELQIGPGLVRRRRTWRFTLLTNGVATHFTCLNPLIDVDIRTPVEQRRRRRISLAVVVPLYVLIVWALYRLGILGRVAAGLAAFFASL